MISPVIHPQKTAGRSPGDEGEAPLRSVADRHPQRLLEARPAFRIGPAVPPAVVQGQRQVGIAGLGEFVADQLDSGLAAMVVLVKQADQTDARRLPGGLDAGVVGMLPFDLRTVAVALGAGDDLGLELGAGVE